MAIFCPAPGVLPPFVRGCHVQSQEEMSALSVVPTWLEVAPPEGAPASEAMLAWVEAPGPRNLVEGVKAAVLLWLSKQTHYSRDGMFESGGLGHHLEYLFSFMYPRLKSDTSKEESEVDVRASPCVGADLDLLTVWFQYIAAAADMLLPETLDDAGHVVRTPTPKSWARQWEESLARSLLLAAGSCIIPSTLQALQLFMTPEDVGGAINMLKAWLDAVRALRPLFRRCYPSKDRGYLGRVTRDTRAVAAFATVAAVYAVCENESLATELLTLAVQADFIISQRPIEEKLWTCVLQQVKLFLAHPQDPRPLAGTAAYFLQSFRRRLGPAGVAVAKNALAVTTGVAVQTLDLTCARAETLSEFLYSAMQQCMLLRLSDVTWTPAVEQELARVACGVVRAFGWTLMSKFTLPSVLEDVGLVLDLARAWSHKSLGTCVETDELCEEGESSVPPSVGSGDVLRACLTAVMFPFKEIFCEDNFRYRKTLKLSWAAQDLIAGVVECFGSRFARKTAKLVVLVLNMEGPFMSQECIETGVRHFLALEARAHAEFVDPKTPKNPDKKVLPIPSLLRPARVGFSEAQAEEVVQLLMRRMTCGAYKIGDSLHTLRYFRFRWPEVGGDLAKAMVEWDPDPTYRDHWLCPEGKGRNKQFAARFGDEAEVKM